FTSFTRVTFYPLAAHSFPTRRSSDLGQSHRGPPTAGGGAGRRPQLVLEAVGPGKPGVFRHALPRAAPRSEKAWRKTPGFPGPTRDRKSTRLNSSHVKNSYAVSCSKNK